MNILYLFSDQQHRYALGRTDPQFITPCLDALAADGILFDNAYSSNPVCGPYRGCLMTGQQPSHCQVWYNAQPLPADRITLAEAVGQAGYATSYVGKWHLGDMGNVRVEERFRPGFERFQGYQCYNGFDPNSPHNNDVLFWDENNEAHSMRMHRTDATTQLAIDELRRLSCQDRPFMLMVSYQAPHYPEQPAPEYYRLYADKAFRMPEDYREVEPYTPTQSPRSPRPFEADPDYRRYGGNMQEYMRLYAGMCTQIDAGIGRIISTLKGLDLYDDTFIVYTSDHGDMEGSRGLKNKCYPYERSAGVPLIMRLPNSPLNGRRSSELVSTVDMFPTILDITGHSVQAELDGVSILPYLKGETAVIQENIVSEYCMGGASAHWRMLRSRQFKLIENGNGASCELYDMLNDPYEQHDLAGCAEYAPRLAEMSQQLHARTLSGTELSFDAAMNGNS